MGTVLTRPRISVTNQAHYRSKHPAAAVWRLTQAAQPTWISSSYNHTRCPYSPLCTTPPLLWAVGQTPGSQTLVKLSDDPLLPVSLAHWQNLPVDREHVKMIGKSLGETSGRCPKERIKKLKNTENESTLRTTTSQGMRALTTGHCH